MKNFDKDKFLNKSVPLNFEVKTWYFIQWLVTFTFLAFTFISFKLNFGYFRGIPLPITIGSLVSYIAVLFAQLYVYGGYISNTKKDILVPLGVTIAFMLVDIFVLFFGKKIMLDLTAKSLIIFYSFSLLHFFLLYITYLTVEYREIKLEDILNDTKLETISNKHIDKEYESFFI